MRRVLNAQMAEGIRLVSIRRGCDPRTASLVGFGGAGPLHATALAEELGIDCVIVPRFPGVLSACGLLCAPTEHELSAACHRDLADTTGAEVREALAELDRRCAELMAAEEIDADDYRIWHSADVCYVGQSHFIEIALDTASGEMLTQLYRDFLAAHDQLYGHGAALPARIVNLRAAARTASSAQLGGATYVPSGTPALKGTRAIVLAGHDAPVEASIFDRHALAVGAEIVAPAIVEQADTTTLIEPGWQGRVSADGTLLVGRA